MAKELLVTDALSDKMIQAGAKLVERLDEDASNIKSALWLYFPDARNWKLILASEIVETNISKPYSKNGKEHWNK